MLGVDVGGSTIRAGLVDLDAGRLIGEPIEVDTPHPATPSAVAQVVADLAGQLGGGSEMGCAFPAIVKDGVARSAANIDPAWIGTDVARLLGEATGRRVAVINDADAAGLAEVRFGAAREVPGVVLVLTLGTGVGSGLFVDGKLVPNTELGHLNYAGYQSAEDYVAAAVKTREGLGWSEWASRLDGYLRHLERIFSPDLFVLGGGISENFARFRGHLTVETPTKPALLGNDAGVVGAALVARLAFTPPRSP
ncbi:MAG: polyphosphate glucokinase [Acidimicrobiia bacterium]|nr:MAG: polyphosphate glucokinase [Acidimicrobiia bacterium]